MAKYLPNDATTLLKVTNDRDHVVEILSYIVGERPPLDKWPEFEKGMGAGGLYMGPTGIAYLFMNVARAYPDLVIKDKSCQEWAAAYLGGERDDIEVKTTNCAVMNETVCHSAVAAAFYHDMAHVHRLLSHLSLLTSSEEGYWEYIYGRSGYLYLLRLVRAWFPESTELIDPAIKSVIEAILENGPPWGFVRDRDFVGMGHGRIGNIVQIMLSDPSYASHPVMESTLTELLSWQQSDGNWPAVRPGSMTDAQPELVQWCHGAPGIVQGLVEIREFFPHLHEKIDIAIEKGREITWEKGLIKKEPNLCHGITGNAFAFPPGEKRDHFIALTTEDRVKDGLADGTLEKCDYGMPSSLGFGGIGRAVGWMWREREKGCFMGFDDV